MDHAAAQQHDFRISERPRDELGEVFDAHNLLLRRVAESKLADRLRAAYPHGQVEGARCHDQIEAARIKVD